MLQNTIKARLIVRNDSSSNWKEKNPILLAGEPGFAVDTGVLKIGDGITPWKELQSTSGTLSGPATEYTLGGVLSSKGDNKISVEKDGTMSINRVSSTLLYTPDDDELILYGGES